MEGHIYMTEICIYIYKKRKPAIFDQMDHRQTNTSQKKRKTKLRSVPRGEADDHERPFKERSQ